MASERKNKEDNKKALPEVDNSVSTEDYYFKLLYDNIECYIKKKTDSKRGTIENDCGVKAGYITSKRKSGNYPSIPFLRKFSKKVNIHIDDLVNRDLSILSEEELELISFFDTLIDRTRNEKISWVFPFDSLDEQSKSINSSFPRTLLKSENDEIVYKSLYDERRDYVTYNKIYYFRINENELMWILPLEERANASKKNIDLYLGDHYGGFLAHKVASTISCNSIINDKICELYELIEEMQNNVLMDLNVHSTIIKFLSDD